MWVVGAVATLLQNRRSPTATLAWIFAFVALPVVSGLYYMVFGPRRLHRRRRRYGIARSLASRVSEHLRTTSCQTRPRLSPGRLGARRGGPAPGAGRAHLRLVGAPAAQRRPDAAGARGGDRRRAPPRAPRVLHLGAGPRRHALPRPARRGARRAASRCACCATAVGSSNLSEAFWRPLTDAGGEVRMFNPVRLSLASINFANFRTHRKIAILRRPRGLPRRHQPARARERQALGRAGVARRARAHRRRAGEEAAAALPRELDLLGRQLPPAREVRGALLPFGAGFVGERAGADPVLGARRRDAPRCTPSTSPRSRPRARASGSRRRTSFPTSRSNPCCASPSCAAWTCR